MGRIVFLLIIVFLVYLVFRGFFRAQTRRKAEDMAVRSEKTEDMVACARCGVNLPRSEAEAQGNAFICRDNPRCLARP